MFLNDIAGQAEISTGFNQSGEVHVRQGSMLSLTCSLQGELFRPETTLNW